MRSLRLRSRSSHRRDTAKARSGSAPRSDATASTISSTSASSSKRTPRRAAGSTRARRNASGEGGVERREVVEDGPQAVLLAATEEEVVAQRQQDVDVGLLREASEERREACLHLRSVQRIELLELVHDDEGFARSSSASAERRRAHGRTRPLRLSSSTPWSRSPIASASPTRSGIEGARERRGPGSAPGVA